MRRPPQWPHDYNGQFQNLCEFIEIDVFKDATYSGPQYTLVRWYVYRLWKSTYKAFQDCTSMWVSQRWTNFCSMRWFEKVLALYLVCGRSQYTQLAGSLKKSWSHNFSFCVRMFLVPKKKENSFFAEVDLVYLLWPHKKRVS